MRDDPLGALELELVAAARRRALGTRGWWRPTVGGLTAAAAAMVALVVAVGAVVLLGHHGGSERTGGSTRTTTIGTYTGTYESVPLALEGRLSALIGTADVGPAHMRTTEAVMRQVLGPGDISATTTAGVVSLPGQVRVELWEVARRPNGEPQIDVLAAVVRGRVIARAPAARVLARGLVFVYGYTASATRVAVVVPNGVMRVRLSVSGVRSTLAPVHRNVAAFEVESFQLVQITTRARVIWYGREGKVIRRVGPESP
jgi:hypothetical protein